MEQRFFHTLQHLPLRLQGGSCTVSVQQQEAPGTGAWGNIRLGHLSGFRWQTQSWDCQHFLLLLYRSWHPRVHLKGVCRPVCC